MFPAFGFPVQINRPHTGHIILPTASVPAPGYSGLLLACKIPDARKPDSLHVQAFDIPLTRPIKIIRATDMPKPGILEACIW